MRRALSQISQQPFYLWLLGIYPIVHLYSENLGLVIDREVPTCPSLDVDRDYDRLFADQYFTSASAHDRAGLEHLQYNVLPCRPSVQSLLLPRHVTRLVIVGCCPDDRDCLRIPPIHRARPLQTDHASC